MITKNEQSKAKVVSKVKDKVTNKENLGKSTVSDKINENFTGDIKDYLEHSRIIYNNMLKVAKNVKNMDVKPKIESRDAIVYFLNERPQHKRKRNKPKYELYYKTQKGYIRQHYLADEGMNDPIKENKKTSLDDLEPFFSMMEHMINRNDKKLVSHDWLAATVDIQAAIVKLTSLS